MNGLINVVFPVFRSIDGVLESLGLAAGIRIAAWGILAGIAAMFIYRMASNQERIRDIKKDVADLRRQLAGAGDDDLSEVLRLSRANLKTSLSLLGAVVLPSLVSTVPVLLLVFWVHQDFGYDAMATGEPLIVRVVPADVDVAFSLPNRVQALTDGEFELQVENHGQYLLAGNASERYAVPTVPAAPVLEKRAWWNMLLGNPAGYIESESTLQRIEFDHPRRTIISGLPGWMSTWEFPFFTALLIASLSLKFGLRIE